MKNWTKPTLVAFNSQAIHSGISTHGAEQVLQCDGVLNSDFIVIFPDDSCAPNGNPGYDCAGIGTLNTVIYVFTSGQEATIAQVCS